MAALGEDLLTTVNKLQDLVFNTIGSDSLDLPQIVSFSCYLLFIICRIDRSSGCCWFAIRRQVFRPRKHRWPGLPPTRQRYRHSAPPHSPAHQRTGRRKCSRSIRRSLQLASCRSPIRVGRISPHPESQVHRFLRRQARDRERDLPCRRYEQGHQQAIHQPQDLLPFRPQLDPR